MKRRPQGPKTGTRVSRAQKPRESHLEKKMLSLIGAHPGIRPSELNRLLNVEQSDSLRNKLIRRRSIRKEKDGSAIRYYLV